MKIIFLDIDGVLNSEKFYRKRGEPNYRFDLEPPYPLCEFDYTSICLLNKILKETESYIVVSSTWRIGRSLEELQDLFNEVGIDGKVIGKTKILQERKNFEKIVRGTEIKMWMDENNFTGNYIIIDDDNDMLPEQQPFFIKTSFWTGITEKNVEDSIKLLNKI